MDNKDILIFCHIPKTAGTSMRHLLFPNAHKKHPKENEYIEYNYFII